MQLPERGADRQKTPEVLRLSGLLCIGGLCLRVGSVLIAHLTEVLVVFGDDDLAVDLLEFGYV